MAKSRYQNSKIITTKDGKKIYSMHNTAPKIDISKMNFIPIEVTENTRLDILAAKYLGNSKYYWIIALVNNIFDPHNIQKGATLLVPENADDILSFF